MCDPVDFKDGAIIIAEGDKSDNRAYFIESGTVEVLKNKKTIAKLGVGDIF